MVKIIHHLPGFFAAIALMLFTAKAAEIQATLDRDSVPAGNGAMLEIKISGGSVQTLPMPAIENFIIQSNGQQRKIEMINGVTSRSTSYIFAVGSNLPGDYEIPAIELTVGGQKLSTLPLKLKVLDAGPAQPPVGIPPTPPGQQPTPDTEEDTSEDRFGFLTVELADNERKHAYVGEIAPVRIRAWIPADSRANLRSGIQPEGQAFTLHNLSDRPQQTQEMKDGKRYMVITWFGGISATKAGKYPASLSVKATVAVRDTSAPKQPRRRMGGAFDDPFFDSVFDQMNTPMIQKDVTLKSVDQEIEIRPLPTEGKPKDFTGAVGDFKFDEFQIPPQWNTGEPQQIRVKISGSGNFALMKAPNLSQADAWKSYSGKDEFTAGDVASFAGSKRFQFSAVPRKGGEQEVALDFSYFDPAVGAYKTIATSPQKIEVTGADMVELEPTAASDAKQPDKKTTSLVGQRTELSKVGTLIPLVARPAFNQIILSAVGLSILGGLLASLRKRREDPKRRALAALEASTREALQAAGKCAASGDVSGYFSAARLAIQQRLGARWNQPAQAITLAEVSARIPEDSPVVRFFQEADHHEYNGKSTGEILPQWSALLDEAMASLTPTAR